MTEPTAPIWLSPARQGGDACITGTRLTCDTLAGRVWAGETPAEVAADFEVTRAQVLAACWFITAYKQIGERRWLAQARKAWARWASDNFSAMWTDDWAAVADPPCKEDVQ